MKIKNIILLGTALLTLLNASLLDSTDFTLLQNSALAGNTAVKALNKQAYFQGSISFGDEWNTDKGSMEVFNAGYKAKVIDLYSANLDALVGYSRMLSAVEFLNVYYLKNVETNTSQKIVDELDETACRELLDQTWKEKLAVGYAVDMSKYNNPALFLGVELAINKETNRDRTFLSQQEMINNGFSYISDDQINRTDPYFSVAFSGAYKLDAKQLVTFAQSYSAAQKWDDKGGRDVDGVYFDTQYNEEVNLIGFNRHTLAASYALTTSDLLEVYYSWANNMDKYTTDQRNNYFEGTKQTIWGANVARQINKDNEISIGFNRTNRLWDDDNHFIDETKTVFNYRMYL